MGYVLKDQTDENLLEMSLLRVDIATLKNFMKISGAYSCMWSSIIEGQHQWHFPYGWTWWRQV